MLRSVDYGENDKILTLLTAEYGRITAGIKGVKKAGAKLKFAAQPFCFAEYILAERAGRYTVIQASECESFYDLRCDVNKFYAACSVCEAAIALTAEEDGSTDLFPHCIRALTDMCGGDESLTLISFLLSALSVSGYKVTLADCSVCGASLEGRERVRFDMDAGAFCCFGCGRGVPASGVTYSTLCAAQNISGFTACKDGEKRALRLLREYLAYKTDAKCLSLNEYINLL